MPPAKSQLGKKTREKKSKTPQSMSALRAEWDSRLTDNERLALRTAGNGLRGDAHITPKQAIEYALEHSFQNSSAVSEKRLKQTALAYGVGSVKPEDVADIAQHPEVLSRMHDGQLFTRRKPSLTTKWRCCNLPRTGRGNLTRLYTIPDSDVNKPGKFVSFSDTLAGLSVEQRKAALHILTERGQVIAVRGRRRNGEDAYAANR